MFKFRKPKPVSRNPQATGKISPTSFSPAKKLIGKEVVMI